MSAGACLFLFQRDAGVGWEFGGSGGGAGLGFGGVEGGFFGGDVAGEIGASGRARFARFGLLAGQGDDDRFLFAATADDVDGFQHFAAEVAGGHSRGHYQQDEGGDLQQADDGIERAGSGSKNVREGVHQDDDDDGDEAAEELHAVLDEVGPDDAGEDERNDGSGDALHDGMTIHPLTPEGYPVERV